ncbi:glycosyltransferase family 1 protein [Tardisphaera miroshnichenkoae]
MGSSAIISNYRAHSGVGNYALRLRSLGLLDKVILFPFENVSERSYAEGYDEVVWPPARSGILRQMYTVASIYFDTRWGQRVRSLDRVHFSNPELFHLSKYNKESYGTVHDIFPITRPKSYTVHYRWYFNKELHFLSKLKKVVAISNYTKMRLLEFDPSLDVVTIHQWTEDDFKPRDKEKVRKELGLPLDKKILLSVGTEEPRKNVAILPQVMNLLGEDYLLVRIGRSSTIRQNFRSKNAIFLEGISQQRMPLYYNASDVLLAPSLDEGFDYPVIEAINSGIWVVASNIPVHREIMRGGGKLIDPNDAKIWVEAIAEVTETKIDWSYIGDYYRKKRALEEYKKLYKS